MRLIWNYLLLITLCSYLFLEYYFAEDVKVGLEDILVKVCSYFHFSPSAKLVALSFLYWIIISVLLFNITFTKEWNNISYRHFAGRLSPFVSSNDASNKKFSWKLFSPLFPFPAWRHRYSTYGLEDWLHDALSRESLLSTSYGQRSMEYEWFRYATFKTYPSDGPSTPLKLAANGFYYTGSGHYVKCFCCGVRNDNWSDSETVPFTHMLISPHCPFANGNLSTNVPINGYRDSVTSGGSNPVASTSPAIGKSTRYPSHESREKRERTFEAWPDARTKHAQFAAAGLFYTGTDDLVRCYCCGIGFKDWSEEDDPWLVHCQFKPSCPHLLANLPRTYTNRALERPVEQQQRGTQETDKRASNISMRDDLTSLAARAVLSKGWPVSYVMDAIERFRKKNGNKPLTTDSIMDNILGTKPNLVTTRTDDAPIRRTIDALRQLNEDQQRTESRSDKKEQLETQQELERLKHGKLCKVCLDKDAIILFLPCGHVVACAECATNLRKCAVCRTIIKGTVRAYMT